MIFSVDSSDSRPIYVQIMDEVRRGIATGLLGADDALPSVRQLAVDLRINPNTVAQAYRELEREGIVEARRGQGTFVVVEHLGARQLKAIARDVADRALRDAHRNGLGPDELIDAIRVLARPQLRRARA
jgi:GntR family transcriptional regulator